MKKNAYYSWVYFVCRLYCAALVGAGYMAYSQHKRNKAEMKEIIQLKNYMAEPITPIAKLERTQDDMKTQIELLIMRIQAEFCRALEKEEDQVRPLYFEKSTF
jgi:coproporphyrinogen III oxidase